jgi:type I restriction enzyme S subunit
VTPSKKVGDIIAPQRKRHKVKRSDYLETGAFPIVDQGVPLIGGYVDDATILYDGELPVILFGDHTCCLKLLDFPFAVGADGTQLFRGGEGIDTRYLYYALKSVDLEQFGYQRHFKLLKECEVPTLSPDQQRRVASILGTFDELIDVNRQRIVQIEGIARAIFEEWFVHFRFPGHERVALTESHNGALPEGWRVGSLGDLVEMRRDRVNPGDHLSDRAYVPIECIPRRSLALAETRPWQDAQSSLHTFERGDILFGAMRAYFHKVCPAPLAGVTRSTVFVLRPLAHSYFSFSTLTLSAEGTVSYASNHAAGSTIPYAQWDNVLERMPQVLPPAALLDRFDFVVRPMLEQIMAFHRTQDILARQRDLLLPRLVSGHLIVSASAVESDSIVPELVDA